MRLILLVTLLCAVSSCVRVDDIDPQTSVVEGLRPVYAIGDWEQISATTPKPIEQLGKIYYKDEIIYAVEQYKGIHVIDNSDPTDPEQIHFFEIVGVRDIAIKGTIMYVDNVTDLVSLDISDLAAPEVLSRVKNLYSNLDQSFPQGYEGAFECADPGAGIVIGWEPAMLEDPKCWR
jgi:cyanate lyase